LSRCNTSARKAISSTVGHFRLWKCCSKTSLIGWLKIVLRPLLNAGFGIYTHQQQVRSNN
jgi:hypothetical protein